MKALLPKPQGNVFLEAFDPIESWEFVILPYNLPGKDRCYTHDFWLGASRNGRTWILAAVPFGDYEDFDPVEAAVAILLDPPKQNEGTIAEILLRIYLAGKTVERLSEGAINEILAAVSFPEYRPVESYLPEAPKDWLQLPVELVVGFTLSEGACITGSTHEEYQRDSVEEALRVVCGPRHDGILISYTLAAREVIPLLSWDVDWPLARRGKGVPERRDKVQGTLPWETETDLSLFTIYQQVHDTGFWLAPSYFGKHVVRLRVGGRTPESAIENWHICARTLRLLKNFSGDGTTQPGGEK